MFKTTLRSLLAHKLRMALTALAVVLGVSFVAGTFVLNDTLNATFDRIFNEANAGVSVNVEGKPLAVPNDDPGDAGRAYLPLGLVAKVRAVDGVAEAIPVLQRSATILDRSGTPIGGQGPPTFGFGWVTSSRLSPYHLRSGRAPAGPAEVVVDVVTARTHGFAIGDTLQVVVANGARQAFTLVGVCGFGSQDGLGGATVVAWDLPVAERVLGAGGKVDGINVAARAGVSDAELRNRIAAALGGDAEVLTGSDATRQATQQVEQGIGIVSRILGAFALVSLFVGCFLIVNTFSILVVQRSREFALLRALGARRRQVLISVLTEALIVGVIASAIGTGCGILVARGLIALINSTGGGGLPVDTLVLGPRTFIVAVALGTAVTLVSSFVPARRAMRVSPMAALRESVPEAQPITVSRIASGLILTILGLALLAVGLFGSSGNRLAELGGGMVITFIGVAVLSPLLVGPIAGLIGAPIARFRGVPGKLARENAERSPRRTASTAAALMVGVALVVTLSTLAASSKASIDHQVGGAMKAQLLVQQKSGGGGQGFSPDVATALRADPRLRDVMELRSGPFLAAGSRETLSAVETRTRQATLLIAPAAGDAAGLADTTIVVGENAATGHGWKVGDRVPMRFPDGLSESLRIVSIAKPNLLLGDYLITLPVFERHYQSQLDMVILLNGASGVSLSEAQSAADHVLKRFPTLESRTQAQFVADGERSITTLLGFLTALLVFSLIIAVIGVVNTLALSIIERTRELGLLRALGMTRRQTRIMVRWESVIIALLGTVLGMVIGVAFGYAVVRALASTGLTTFAVTWWQLIAALVLALVLGVIAAVFPGMRASRLRLLDALGLE